MTVPATAFPAPGCTRAARPRPENTRPRLNRCLAHRVRPDRPDRPRSRPVFGPPLRQLASDPFHPVEGGSANDYDYCAGDPVNCNDLDGLYTTMETLASHSYLGSRGTIDLVSRNRDEMAAHKVRVQIEVRVKALERRFDLVGATITLRNSGGAVVGGPNAILG